jgi:ankyrin repeat protein
MWLTFAVLMGTLVNPAAPASLPALAGANSSVQTDAEKDKKKLNRELDEAVEAGDAEKTRALLRKGADPGQALILAVNRNDTVIAGILIEAGANVNGVLVPAVAGDHEEMVRFLLAHGAKVDGDDPGESPLHTALVMNRLDMARILIAAGADVKAQKAYEESHHMPDFAMVLQKALGPPPPPMTAEQVIRYLEGQVDSRELGGAPQNSEPPTAADVTRAVSELRAQLKAKPQDTHALMLWARFAFIPYPEILATGYRPSSSEKDFLSPAVALDRVLAAEPTTQKRCS